MHNTRKKGIKVLVNQECSCTTFFDYEDLQASCCVRLICTARGVYMLPLFVYTETHSIGNFAVYRTLKMSYKRQKKKTLTFLNNNRLFSN